MVSHISRARAIAQHHTFKATIIRFAHGGVHTNIGGDTSQYQGANAARMQHQLQVCGAKRSFSGFIDDRLTRRQSPPKPLSPPQPPEDPSTPEEIRAAFRQLRAQLAQD